MDKFPIRCCRIALPAPSPVCRQAQGTLAAFLTLMFLAAPGQLRQAAYAQSEDAPPQTPTALTLALPTADTSTTDPLVFRDRAAAAAAVAAADDAANTDPKSGWWLSRRDAQFVSKEGNIAFLALGAGLPLLTDRGATGRTRTLRTVDALATSTAITYLLKKTTHQLRPDNSTRDSFPSGHATAAFTVAAMQSQYHRKQAPFWYAGAALISYSRVRLDRHRPRDILAGAAIGIGTAEGEVSTRRGLLLSPFLVPRADGNLSLGWGGSF